MKSINRRRFLQNTSVGLFAYPWIARLFGKEPHHTDEKSHVVVIQDSFVLDNNRNILTDRIQKMTDTGIQSLTGIDDTGEAWKSLFPGINNEKVVCIKVNCLFSLTSHPEVAYAISNGLQQMSFDGIHFQANNIIIWDRTDYDLTSKGGYTINTGHEGVRIFGTRPSSDYASETYDVNGRNQKISKILTDLSDYMINLCVLKNHSIAQVTFSMKNHYGTCHNPDGLHGNLCNPYIPELNALAPIREKQMLCICDALFGIISGGPGGAPQVAPKKLIFSRDTVALDTICLDILNGYRNIPINMPAHIATAASSAYHLGTNDRARINRVDIDITTQNSIRTITESTLDFQLYQNYPNPFNAQTILTYRIHKSGSIKIDITDIHGKSVRTLFRGQKNAGFYQIHWDGKSQANHTMPSGIYLARITNNQARHTIRMQLIK
ncbi:DUF362 domain-containing protein [bacterium]|nr:DUF362 domain-containing protein [bacterium]